MFTAGSITMAGGEPIGDGTGFEGARPLPTRMPPPIPRPRRRAAIAIGATRAHRYDHVVGGVVPLPNARYRSGCRWRDEPVFRTIVEYVVVRSTLAPWSAIHDRRRGSTSSGRVVG